MIFQSAIVDDNVLPDWEHNVLKEVSEPALDKLCW